MYSHIENVFYPIFILGVTPCYAAVAAASPIQHSGPHIRIAQAATHGPDMELATWLLPHPPGMVDAAVGPRPMA
jgi:hypothetical protein